MSKKNRPAFLAEQRFVATLPHKITRDEYTEIFCIGYRCGIADALVELRAKFSPSTPTPNDDTHSDAAGQPSILTQEIAQ